MTFQGCKMECSRKTVTEQISDAAKFSVWTQVATHVLKQSEQAESFSSLVKFSPENDSKGSRKWGAMRGKSSIIVNQTTQKGSMSHWGESGRKKGGGKPENYFKSSSRKFTYNIFQRKLNSCQILDLSQNPQKFQDIKLE